MPGGGHSKMASRGDTQGFLGQSWYLPRTRAWPSSLPGQLSGSNTRHMNAHRLLQGQLFWLLSFCSLWRALAVLPESTPGQGCLELAGPRACDTAGQGDTRGFLEHVGEAEPPAFGPAWATIFLPKVQAGLWGALGTDQVSTSLCCHNAAGTQHHPLSTLVANEGEPSLWGTQNWDLELRIVP